MFKTDKGQILKFKESFNKDDFDILPKRERPKFDIGEYVKLNRNFFYRHVDIEKPKSNGWEVEDVKEISGGFKYYVVNSDYFDGEDDEQEGFWVWDDEIKKDDKGKFKESYKKFGKKFSEGHAKGEHLYSVIVKKPGGWDGSFQVNAMNGDEALEKAKARLGRGSRILRIEDIGEYKAFDADDYAGFDESYGDDTILDVPVTNEEKELASFLEQEIHEKLGLACSCEPHNPGEEMHIEIFVSTPDDEDSDIDQICEDLEELVNKIGSAENEKWGKANFNLISDDEIFGEVWPIEGEYSESNVHESTSDWFDEKYGWLQKDIPEECVMDCSGPGRKDDAVAYWVDELKFYIPQPLIEKAKNYLREFGAWEEDELDQWAETEDVEHQLAQHILWCFCCDLREGNVEAGELYLGH